MTFDERLEEIFSTFWNEQSQNIFKAKNHEQLEKMQRESLSEAITAIKQAMRETLPEKKKLSTDYLTQDDSISKSHKREVAYYNTAIDEIEKGFGLDA